MLRLLLPALCALAVWPSLSSADGKDANYLLNPGDVIFVSVWREDALKEEVHVLPDGSITFPLVGRIAVAGLDSTAVEKLITTKLEAFMPEPNVSVVVRDPKGNLVYAQGKVLKPGPLQLAGPTTVLQVLSMAGGLDKFAEKDDIKVVRNKKVMPVNYDYLISGKDMSTNYELQAGDTLVVP
ncbi:polysaccharide biosynthesis/export family protein [Pseudomonas sp. NFX15]|uniref:polysaccharide biosynthesis/export family protein n=1 Tax=Pseudomonas sp. NFX15 TaxID=2816958 RepID=UPI003B8CCB68